MNKEITGVEFQLGAKIRSFRTLRHLTQKQLADECGLSESAIRNYELGNRYPDEDTLMTIADALEIDRATLRDPDPNSPSSVEHFLFALDQLYGFVPKLIDGELHFVFDKTTESTTNQQIIRKTNLAEILYNWCGVRDLMVEGKITPDEYYAWQIAHSDSLSSDEPIYGYPPPMDQRIEAETARRALGKKPAPVFDENHVNVMPIPKDASIPGKTPVADVNPETSQKTKRKRKPKSK